MPAIRAAVAACLVMTFGSWCFAGDAVSDGIAAFNQGKYAEAVNLLKAPAGAGDNRATVYLALSQAGLSNCDAALPVLTRTASSDPALRQLAGTAAVRCYTTSANMPKALALAEDLKAEFPDNADVLYLAAETEMKAFNQTTFAMFQRTPSSYRVHELSATIFEVQNRYSDAVAEYQKAIEISPSAPDLHFRLGRAILLESHSAEALKSAAEAFAAELKISPEDSACEFQMGQIARIQGQPAEAQQHFERAVKLSPNFVAAMIALASIYSRDKRYEQAIALLQRAVALQPANESAHYTLLTAYRDAGQMDKAAAEKATLDRLQQTPEGEFSDFLKKLGDKQTKQ